MNKKFALGAALLAWTSAAQATVDYAIDLTSPEHHSGKVSISFSSTNGEFLDVKMPAWRTGRYEILNLANGVSGFAATAASGRPVSWQKIDKSMWRIWRPSGARVSVSYDIYANELLLRTRHIDESHAYIDASAVFMYADRFDAALAEHQPGDAVRISFFRRDQLLQKALRLGGTPQNDARVVPVQNATPAQTALFERWLLIPYPKDVRQ